MLEAGGLSPTPRTAGAEKPEQTQGGAGRGGSRAAQKADLQAELRLASTPVPGHRVQPPSPLSVLSFHLGQAAGGVHQIAPEATDVPGLQGLVDQDHS